MLAISPWSRGGWVNSEVFDHTSVIRFLETRFGVMEPNITPWRRSVCGDLTSVFDFAQRDPPARLVSTSGYVAAVDATARLPPPGVPAVQAPPSQEPGGRPARALPYRLQVHGAAIADHVVLTFVNDGAAGAPFSVWSAKGGDGPWFYTVRAGARLTAELPLGPAGYDLTVHGPNGFLRRLAGGGAGGPEIEAAYQPDRGQIAIIVRNGEALSQVTVTPGVYPHGAARAHALGPGQTLTDVWRIDRSAQWYDLIVTASTDPHWARRLSGHMETGRSSLSDPAIA